MRATLLFELDINGLEFFAKDGLIDISPGSPFEVLLFAQDGTIGRRRVLQTSASPKSFLNFVTG